MMRRGIIMGASSGLGREVARLLLERGWRLGIAARREEPLRELQEAFPGQVTLAKIDVNDPQAPSRLQELIAATGGMELYFHAAGVGWQNPELDPAPELATVETNALGFTRMVTAAYRHFAESGGGHIAAITSIAGTKGLGAAPAYSATKAFQNTYLQALEQQAVMRKLGIRVTDIRPGFVATPLLGDDPRYPMLLRTRPVARAIVRAVERKKHIRVIDWRWRIVTALWRRIPRCLWRRLHIG